MTRRWGRLRTSQWHLVHSIRADAEGNEYILTVDGEFLPTMRVKWEWPRPANPVATPTGAKTWTGDGRPKGRTCSRCLSFVYSLDRTTEIS